MYNQPIPYQRDTGHPLDVFPGAQYIPNTSVDRMLYIREVI